MYCLNVFKVVCCKIVVCEKGLNKMFMIFKRYLICKHLRKILKSTDDKKYNEI